MVHRRTIVAGLAALPALAISTSLFGSAFAQDAAPASDTLDTNTGPVTIYPVSHASLVLAAGGEVIYVDPVGGAALYADLPKPTSILITHGHGDHFDPPTLAAIGAGVPMLTNQEVYDQLAPELQANATAIGNGEDGMLNAIPVRAIAAHNTTPDRMQYHPVGVGNGYVLTFGDKEVYVAGDTEPTPEMLALSNIAVAFLPMNLPYTMTVEQAAQATNTFRPTVVYPYHHRDSDVAAFAAAVDEGIEVRLRDWYPAGAPA